MNLAVLRRWKLLVAVLFLLLLGAEVHVLIRSEKTQMLARRAQGTAAQLVDFAQARAQLTERRPDESFDQYSRRVSAENAETQSLYSKQFYGQVAQLREEFAQRGVRDQELDQFYREPNVPIGIREVGERLSALADTVAAKQP